MKFLKTVLVILALLISLTQSGCRKSEFLAEEPEQVYTDYGQGTGTVTWKKDKIHLIEGLVFVNDGQTLTIEAGSVIRFRAGQGENASALIVARGGKIIAQGSPGEPIIFTSEKDDLQGSVDKSTGGLWGGLIILGDAPVNHKTGEGYIEGIPQAEPRGFYGGLNSNDNSGVLKYVSIRYGGTNIGEGNEINGLTLAGVGRGTEIDYLEVFSNSDDGIEIFGGNVNLRHIVVSGCGDDAVDYDLGWSGQGQFWLLQQENYRGDNLIEAGGGVNPVNALPYSLPEIYNITCIGNGKTGAGYFVKFERNAGGYFANSVFLNNQYGISLEATDLLHDSYNQFKKNKLKFLHNLFFDVGENTPETIFGLQGIYTDIQRLEWVNHFMAGYNNISDPKINFREGSFVPREKIKGNLTSLAGPWFQMVDFTGAFGESNWIEDWTLLSEGW
jgi:hypothetical protein